MKIHTLAILVLFQSLFACNESPGIKLSAAARDSRQKTGEPAATNIIFKSTDGGQTWQDLSEGLPENLQAEVFFANDNRIFLRRGSEIYHSEPNSTTAFWEKKNFSRQGGGMAAGKTGMLAFNADGQILQNISGTNTWSPVYTNFPKKGIRTVFETAGGNVFIGWHFGLFKSPNGGKNWNPVYNGGSVTKIVELNGVLMAAAQKGIIRSIDNGETWETVISEGGIGIDIEQIEGGFAAITYNTESETRRVRTSYDGGKTWQPIDAGLPKSPLIASIVQVGDDFFCGHPDGIFQSSDKGKTWKLMLPSVKNKVFNLSVSGNVIYAMPRNGGC